MDNLEKNDVVSESLAPVSEVKSYVPPQVFNLTDLVPENGSTPNINENTGGVLES